MYSKDLIAQIGRFCLVMIIFCNNEWILWSLFQYLGRSRKEDHKWMMHDCFLHWMKTSDTEDLQTLFSHRYWSIICAHCVRNNHAITVMIHSIFEFLLDNVLHFLWFIFLKFFQFFYKFFAWWVWNSFFLLFLLIKHLIKSWTSSTSASSPSIEKSPESSSYISPNDGRPSAFWLQQRLSNDSILNEKTFGILGRYPLVTFTPKKTGEMFPSFWKRN